MPTYAFNKWGIAVNTSCAKCEVTLVDDSLEPDNVTKVQVPEYRICEGKVKSSNFCGEEMACSI